VLREEENRAFSRNAKENAEHGCCTASSKRKGAIMATLLALWNVVALFRFVVVTVVI